MKRKTIWQLSLWLKNYRELHTKSGKKKSMTKSSELFTALMLSFIGPLNKLLNKLNQSDMRKEIKKKTKEIITK